MNIIKLKPAYKDYLWGGNKLRELYGKEADLDCIAESWELSTHPDGQSIVASGEFEGKTFGDYLEAMPKSILGTKGMAFEFFPILIKFIDAKKPLSIQVHPNDEYALKNEHSYGKTEMWYILSCEKDAFIYYGVNQKLTKEEFKEHIENNTVTNVLHKAYVKPGDTFFIESGTIHAIGAGIVICEIQQNSNLTYRVYDYDRRDAQGNARPLHVEKAMQVCNLEPIQRKEEQPAQDGDGKLLATCKYFTTTLYNVEGSKTLKMDDTTFKSIIVVEGNGVVKEGNETLSFKKGDSLFVPAHNGEIVIEGNCQIIVSNV